MILGCDFWDRFVEAIYPRQKCIESDDGTTVPLVRRPLKRVPKAPPLPPSQEYEKADGRTTPKVRVAEKTCLPPESQTWVTATSQRHGMMVLQPYDALYDKQGVITTNGVVQVQPNVPFRILVANFTNKPKYLVKNQVVATLLPHPTEVIPTKIHLHEVLGLADDASDLSELTNALERATIDAAEFRGEPPPAKSGEAKPPPTVDDVDLSHLDVKYHARVRALLSKYLLSKART